MVTGNATLVKLLPNAPVNVLRTGNFNSGVNLVGRESLSRLVDMSEYILAKTSFFSRRTFFIKFSVE